jgi:competence protein ComGC
MQGDKKGCPQCNEIPSAGAATCEYCGFDLSTHRRAPVEKPGTWEPASRLSRLACFFLDRLALIPMFLTIIGPVIYIFWKDCFWNGQSLGKRAGSLRVIDVKTEQPCTGGQSVIRNLTLLIPLVNLIEFVLVLCGSSRLGDRVAGTHVVQPRGTKQSVAVTLGILAACMFGGISILGVLAAIAVPNFAKARERANTRACFANQKTIAGAVEMYRLDKSKTAEQTGQLDHQFFVELKSGGYLMSIPTDPGKGPGTDNHYYFQDPTSPLVACRVHGNYKDGIRPATR